MIIRSKAPLRLGLAGGGSDVSPYSDIFGGLVLNATINLYAYTTIEETDDGMITIQSYDCDYFEKFPVTETLPIDGKASLIKGTYNRVVKDFKIPLKSFKITTYNDAPAGSGLGTSSTMVVSILKAFVEWHDLPLGNYEMARLAYEIERKDLNLSGGKQDQYAAAFGGFNYMEFLPGDVVIVNPLKVKRWIVDELEASMVLYFTGRSRSSAQIIDEQKRNTETGNSKSIEAMHRIKQGAIDMKFAILKGDMDVFCKVLGKNWEDKKQMANAITNSMIEQVFDVALASGAKSGKVSGAGGGGFIMLFVEPTRKKEVVEALEKLDGFVVPFDFTDGGAHGWKIYNSENEELTKH
ncbi:D-glycero-alpha-D-manno-heptose-7-phosphate kinase [Fibrobacter sp. UWT3]|uniref:GHMP family kinase ATP-binding protein n=1 Tax=Fibrobacter sp. UWT3 TaxID=1896225 RepID=UPI000BDD3BFA|nr:dehydrogenase [Fibrobacter sp. UWT3]SOE76609.1 D-glycero-alpha-D-manno-heptose-7-phosphate kinase [Fibrobacter sp. UWT3]